MIPGGRNSHFAVEPVSATQTTRAESVPSPHSARCSGAAGVRGGICRSADGGYGFRVSSDDNGSFSDSGLMHDQFPVTIATDERASL
jgi:hypothetical protein